MTNFVKPAFPPANAEQSDQGASDLPLKPIQIAVVGDVHDQWDERDEAALSFLDADLVLFVGDFGNEAVEIVRRVAQLPMPKAIALGNHDAWHSATPWGRKKCPYDRTREDRVQQQLDALGATHAGYSSQDFWSQQLSVVGGRPFSWGGRAWKYSDFYEERFGVHSMEESRDRIIQSTQQAQFETVIVLSHNGPAGLGDRPEDPCGRDWQPTGGDYGDPDLQAAVKALKNSGKQVPFVTFGHMHHALRHRKDRLRQRVYQDSDGTVYLNAACVPRTVEWDSVCYHNFSVVQLVANQVTRVRSLFISAQGAIAAEEILFEQSSANLSRA